MKTTEYFEKKKKKEISKMDGKSTEHIDPTIKKGRVQSSLKKHTINYSELFFFSFAYLLIKHIFNDHLM